MSQETKLAPSLLLKKNRVHLPKASLFTALVLLSFSSMAQGEEMSGGMMRSHLKIYVVVAVLTLIFAGIIFFLFSLERRLKKLEEKQS
jgi:cbb3-type cytochrome oxidase subunit 3